MVPCATVLSRLDLKSAIVRDPLIVSPEAAVMEAVAQMSGVRSHGNTLSPTDGQLDTLHQEARASCVWVVEAGRVVGILTERDIVHLNAQQQSLDRLPLRQVMAHPGVTLQEPDLTDWVATMELLQQHRIRHLPILDEQGCLVGVVTRESLLQVLNPLELYKRAAALEAQVAYLEAEKSPQAAQLETAPVKDYRATQADIPDRKQTEEQLRNLSERLNWAVKSAGLGIWEWDLVRNIKIWDNRMYELYGIQLDRLENFYQAWLDSLHPDDRALTESALQQALRGEKDYEAAFRVIHPDGSLRFLQAYGLVQRDEQGRPLRIIGINFDITERKQAELALQESQRFIQQIADASPNTLYLYDIQEQRTLYINREVALSLGYTSTEIQAMGSSLLQNLMHPDDLSRFLLHTERIHQVSDGEIIEFEYRMRHVDGKWQWFYSRDAVFNRDGQGQVKQIIGVAQDISARKHAEEQLRNLSDRLTLALRAGEIGTWDWDILHEATWDDRMYEMYGLQELGRPATYQDWSARVHADDLAATEMALQAAVRGEQTFDVEFRIWRTDGALRWIKAIALLQQDSQGNPLRMTGINYDITDRKQAEQAQIEKADEIEDLYNNAPCGYHSLDTNGCYIQVNETELTWLGYRREEMLGRPVSDFLTEDSRQAFLRNYPRFQAQGWVKNLEYEMICKDGSLLPVLISATAVKDAEGKYLYNRATLVDIRDRKQTEQIICQHAEREALLRQITQRIRQSLDLQTIFETACDEIRQVLQSDRVGIFKFYPESNFDDGEFVAESVVGGFPSVLTIPVHDHCFGENYASLYAKGRYHVADDIYHNGLKVCHTSILARFQVQANLVMPLLCGDQLWGLLCIHQCSTTRHWQPFEIDFSQQLANQLAIAIQQVSLYDQIEAELWVRQQAEEEIALQLQRQQTLGRITQQIRESLSIDEILAMVTQQVKALLQSDRVIIFRLFPDGRSQIVEEAVSREFPALKLYHWSDETWSQDILNYYWQGLPRIVPDVMGDVWTDCLREYNIEGQIQSKMVAPILQDVGGSEVSRWITPSATNKLWGILVVHACGAQRVWQESEAQLLQQIANQLAIAIQQANLFEQLQQELTERQQAQQQLTERNQELAVSNQELARATRLKDEFLANMSHELRTPLNAILGMTEGLQECVFGDINSGQLKALQTIERSGSHLLELINDILDVAKIESGQIVLDCAPTAIALLCQSSLAFIKQQALKKRIQLEIKLPPDLPDLVVDERRIRQVLINLLNNAVKFTPAGGRIILEVSYQSHVTVPDSPPLPGITRVRVYRTPLEQQLGLGPQSPAFQQEGLEVRDYLRISVIDTGIGIAPEHLDKLFQPFIQIDSALNRQYTGTGLGLALVKRIVELHGGQVGLTSEVGVGSCFTIDLPYQAAVPLPNLAATDSSAPEISRGTSEPNSLQESSAPLLLLVEDNEANFTTIASYLEARGYRLLWAKDGLESLALAESAHPDLVLMDIQMPKMDGLEAIQQLRLNPNLVDVPIIALTALAMAGDRGRCLAAGANGYLSKPVKLKELATLIQTHLAAGSGD